MNRREFLGSMATVAATSTLRAQGPPAAEWGSPVFDLHFHFRQQVASNLAHLDGAGISRANFLTSAANAERIRALQQTADRFTWFASTDITRPEAEGLLTAAVKAGAIGFGELKFHVAADGPELRRVAALAADLQVPLLIHFQEVDHFPGEGTWSTGYARTFESMLKAFPRTTFIGHADAFWANVSADYRNEAAYPSGPIVRGGITDKLLGDYQNLFGDLAANSGNNALSRDAEFTADFLRRHQNKLMFGSDCSCADGRGSGVSQANNPAAARLAGKCVARETLAILTRATTPEVFRKLTWENAHKILRVS
jgi:predicted TIM-barrel fold metal-dependent hydrolase